MAAFRVYGASPGFVSFRGEAIVTPSAALVMTGYMPAAVQAGISVGAGAEAVFGGTWTARLSFAGFAHPAGRVSAVGESLRAWDGYSLSFHAGFDRRFGALGANLSFGAGVSLARYGTTTLAFLAPFAEAALRIDFATARFAAPFLRAPVAFVYRGDAWSLSLGIGLGLRLGSGPSSGENRR